MVRAVYIAGLEHTGSTVLEMLLSCHPRVCGLGEVTKWTQPARVAERLPRLEKLTCSCGQPIPDCPLWKNHVQGLQAGGAGSAVDNYLRLLDVAEQAMGADVIWCDSSKSSAGLLDWLQTWQRRGVAKDQLLVVHITKDARNWVASQKRRYGLGFLGTYGRFSLWKTANRQIAEVARREGLACLDLGYEALCFEFEASVERLRAALQLPSGEPMHDLRNSQGHIGAGNPTRIRPRSRFLRYDHSWFFDWDVNLWYWLRRSIRRSNRERVYATSAETSPNAA